MIAVIADDLSGAAELAGIGLRNKLQVEMNTEVNENTKAEMLVIASDTRSLKEVEAIAEMKKITLQVAKLNPEMIFKKVDSVLRGHVLSELCAQLKILNLERVLLVPANPALGRTITNGTYFFYNQPIHLSSFSNDPEFPITSSDVLEMLHVNNDFVQIKKKEEALPDLGIIIGEASSSEDLKAWAKRIDKKTLVAGGAGFFSAILDGINIKGANVEQSKAKQFSQPILFVCGSTFNKSREIIKKINSHGGPVSYMPEAIMRSDEFHEDLYLKWGKEIVSFIESRGKAIISINQETEQTFASPGLLRERIARVVEEVFRKIKIRELLIEGGSTAAAVLRKLQLKTFFPLQEIAIGVIRMRVKDNNDLCITVKPGSYEWPAEVWKFN